MWHGNNGGALNDKSSTYIDHVSVTDQCNNLRYIFGLTDKQGKPPKGKGYKSALVQNILWYCESGASDATGIYDIRTQFGLTGVSGSSNLDTNMISTMLRANTHYNKYDEKYKNPTKAKTVNGEITAYKNSKNETVLGLFQMNAYSEDYNADCGAANSHTNYNGYGNTGDKRRGVLLGIVDAELVLEQDGKKQVLKWSDKQFTFSYGKYGTQQGKKITREYSYFPGPSSKFFVKVKEGIIDENKETKVTLKFKSIQTKAKEIKDATVIYINKEGVKQQPLLLCSGGMTVKTWTSETKFKIPPTSPAAKINTYISEVDGGREANDKGQAGKGYTYKNAEVQFKGTAGDQNIMKTSNIGRAKWSENKKNNKKALIEKGDKVTFTVVITNLTDYAIQVQNVPLSGCIKGNEVTITDEDGKKILGGYNKKKVNDKTITLKLDQKVAKNSTYKFKVTISSMYEKTDKTEDVYKYLKAELGTIKKASSLKKLDTAPSSSKDYFTYKNYYVTIDKYIEETEVAISSDSVDDGNSSMDDLDNDTGDDSSSSTNQVDEDDDAGYDIPPEEDPGFDDRIYLATEDGTVKIVDGVTYRLVTRKDGRDSHCYKKDDNTYYYWDSTQECMCYLNVHTDAEGTYYILAEDLEGPISESTNRVYLKWSGKGPEIGDHRTFEKYPGKTYAVIYQENTDDMACYMDTESEKFYIIKEGSYTTDISKAELTEVTIRNEGTRWFYEIPEPEITKLYLDSTEDGTIIRQLEAVDNYFYPVYKKDTKEVACYYHPGMWEREGDSTRYCYIKSKATGYYEQIPIRWDSVEKAWYANMEEYFENPDRIYLAVDEQGRIVGRGRTEEGYLEVWNQTKTEIACYYKEDEGYFYRDGNGKYHSIRLESIDGYYISKMECDNINDAIKGNRIYLNVDGTGNIIKDTKADDNYFYPVFQKGSETEIVCYYHSAIHKYFVKSSEEYQGVFLHRDGNDWYFTEEDYEDIAGKIYLEVASFGSIPKEDGHDAKGYAYIKDITGKDKVCLRKDGKYYVYSDDEYQEITVHPDEYGFYILDKEITNINNPSDSSESDADEGVDGNDEDSNPSLEEPNNRSLRKDETKKNSPVEVNAGDTVKYAMVVYNTVNGTGTRNWTLEEKGSNRRKMGGFYAPKVVFVDIKDTLPQEYIKKVSSLEVKCSAVYSSGTTKETTYNVSVNGSGEFSLEGVFVPAGGYTKITYSVVVGEEVEIEKTKPAVNTATITKLRNGNMAVVDGSGSTIDRNKANAQRRVSRDYFYTKEKEEKPPEKHEAGNVYVHKVEHLTVYPQITIWSELSEEVKNFWSGHGGFQGMVEANANENKDPQAEDPTMTFKGKGDYVYAEYADKITYGISFEHSLINPDPNEIGFRGPRTFEYYREDASEYDYAEVTLRITIPPNSATYFDKEQGKECYIVWVNESPTPIFVPVEEGPYFMYKYTIRSNSETGGVNIVEDVDYLDPVKHDKIRWRPIDLSVPEGHSSHNNCGVDNKPCEHKLKRVNGISSMTVKDDSVKISIVNNANVKDQQVTLDASIVNIDYHHSYGRAYEFEETNETQKHTHYYKTWVEPVKDEEGKIIAAGYWKTVEDETYYNRHINCREGNSQKDYFNYGPKELGAEKKGDDPRVCSHCGEQIYTGGFYLGDARCIVSEYNMKLDERISNYNGAMYYYNTNHGLETGAMEGANENKHYDEEAALPVEKYEEVTFRTRVTNDENWTVPAEMESNISSGEKYKTRARPQTVSQKITPGLKIKDIKIYRVRKNYGESSKTEITKHFKIEINGKEGEYTTDGNAEAIISYRVKTDNMSALSYTLLGPGDYIDYEVKTEVTESNMYLGTMNSTAELTSVSNVNFQKLQWFKEPVDEMEEPYPVVEGMVVPSLVNNRHKVLKDSAYVKIKELIIAGKVFLDTNKNGFNDDGKAKEGVTVRLVRNDGVIDTVQTDANGLYTFGRRDRSSGSGYYQYYVEFEYDGLMYRATDVYGGVNGKDTGENYGMGMLDNNPAQWREGYSDLPCPTPGARRGNGNYMNDSNAYEFDNMRNLFDEQHQTIGYNSTYQYETRTSNISYNKSQHTSTLLEDKNRIMTARSFIKQNFKEEVNGERYGFTNMKPLYLANYGGYHNEFPETEYLKFINLGLVERERVDLSIKTDVASVTNVVNGEEMTYQYGYNPDAAYAVPNGTYRLGIYEADYRYRYDKNYDDETVQGYKNSETSGNAGELNPKGKSELTTQVTYKVIVKNELIDDDIPVRAKINELAIFYDSRYMQPLNNSNYDDLKATVRMKDPTTGMFVSSERAGISANGMDYTLSDKSRYTNQQLYDNGNQPNGDTVLYVGLNNEIYIDEGYELSFYITFTIDKDAEDNRRSKILDDGNKEFSIITQISAFTTKYGADFYHKGLADRLAGLVDRDSNPGNLGLGNGVNNKDNSLGVDFYEDDTYKAGIGFYSLGLGTGTSTGDGGDEPPVRTARGTVWDDARTATAEKDGAVQYIGNGQNNKDTVTNEKVALNPYNYQMNADGSVKKDDTGKKLLVNYDKPIQNVKVSLWEIVQTEAGKYYEVPAKNSKGGVIETLTDANGNYMLEDFVPGYYKVRFDYGYDKNIEECVLYNGQDYKSTQYSNPGYYTNIDGKTWDTDNVGAQAKNDYYNKVKEHLGKDKLSDAQDDEIRRLEVNSYSETMTTSQAQVFSETKAFSQMLVDNTSMYADSTIFYITTENTAAGVKEIATNSAEFAARFWRLGNLDFGIEYRPEASIVLEKDIKTVELVTSDGTTLIKLYFEPDPADSTNRVINKTKSIGADKVQYIGNGEKGEKGFVYINMDSNILEGCTINVEYEFGTTNQSEVDRINKNLSNVAFESNAKGYDKVYKQTQTINPELSSTTEKNYSANATVAKYLTSQYYSNDKKYLTKLKKSYDATTPSQTLSNSEGSLTLYGKGYYGMYLGETYYTGKVGANDEVVDLKVDNILDYLDNDLSFSTTDNMKDNSMWNTKKSEELATVLDWSTVDVEQKTSTDGKYKYNVYYNVEGKEILAEDATIGIDTTKLIEEVSDKIIDFRTQIKYGNIVDSDGIKYDTDLRSNLLMSVDTNKKGDKPETGTEIGNKSLSRFLKTINVSTDRQETTGQINLLASKVLSATDVQEGTALSYDNKAEVVQYTLLTGRRTKLPDADEKGGIIATGVPDIIGSDRVDPRPPTPTPPDIIGSDRTDPIIDRFTETDIIGSDRTDPTLPPDVVGRVQNTIETYDLTETIMISPPTGLPDSER